MNSLDFIAIETCLSICLYLNKGYNEFNPILDTRVSFFEICSTEFIKNIPCRICKTMKISKKPYQKAVMVGLVRSNG